MSQKCPELIFNWRGPNDGKDKGIYWGVSPLLINENNEGAEEIKLIDCFRNKIWMGDKDIGVR